MSASVKARGGTAKERSVFVGNIPYDVTEEQLREIFSEVGSVLNFRLVTDRETGKPKGYGFCEYADGATALSAMRNLNGYEINGRNLRVDFADGGDKSGSSGEKTTSGVSGEVLITAIEGAISKFGPLKLYDMLVNLKEHARQRPEYTKSILNANPALTHAIVQCFKTLNIPIPAASETQPLLAAPPLLQTPGLLRAPQPGVLPPPQRSPLNAGPGGGGILGMAPPGAPPIMGAPPPAKAGGTRWSSRPGPLSAAGGPVPPHAPVIQSAPPLATPPVQQPLMPTPSVPASSTQRSRDPRRARDPRLAKRPAGPEPTMPDKRMKMDDQMGPGRDANEYNAIAELARDMTPEKLNMLPPNERQMLLSYMQQHGLNPQY
ncbi:hypothetical protein Poli38472_004347 [Pythium oligandrum]|uniref:RRM domain-containing protein n=1 Tax=Pythium oligandrum TaxID=41045 RepID=A0A8K1FI09_PYTOL|nr:hypothetical protein Poli38472_004347 [Pythium oligandrum]|eukprot:TMW59278.1 hypothetical protein Poli38472_004347 [Pythium oligandrum]